MTSLATHTHTHTHIPKISPSTATAYPVRYRVKVAPSLRGEIFILKLETETSKGPIFFHSHVYYGRLFRAVRIVKHAFAFAPSSAAKIGQSGIADFISCACGAVPRRSEVTPFAVTRSGFSAGHVSFRVFWPELNRRGAKKRVAIVNY